MSNIWKEINLENNIIETAKKISEENSYKMLLSLALALKGFKDKKEIQEYINPSIEDLNDPFLMPDMKAAVDRIEKAIANNEKILIYGDYDVDGITSSTVLNRFLKEQNVKTDIYIPNRLTSGYGLNINAIENIAKANYDLIITVDCGITAVEEIKRATELNVDVIVTDHHEPGEILPEAIAVIDCKRQDSKYPFRELCGCGVSFKLCQAIAKRRNLADETYLKYIDLVAIATISDVVELSHENRTITKLGIKQADDTNVIGLDKLIKNARVQKLDSYTVAFGIAPRINAAGRMGKQNDALRLLLTDSLIEAENVAKQIEGYNSKRQDIEKDIYKDAIRQIEEDIKNGKENKILVVANDNWHTGVIGIVASKITEKYNLPSILISLGDEISRGSGRSIKGFDMHDAIVKNSKHLINAGGHEMAIGLSLDKESYPLFKKEIEEYVNENLNEECLVKEIVPDIKVTKELLTIEAVEELSLLEPYGNGNEKLVVEYDNLQIEQIRTLTDGKHIKLLLKDDDFMLDVIGFNKGYIINDYQIGDKVDIVGNIEINEYLNQKKVQMVLTDIRKR